MYSVNGIPEVCAVAQDLVDFLFEYLRVEDLLGVFPFVERFALVQSFVTLHADQVCPGGGRPYTCDACLSNACRALNEDWFLHLLRQVDNRGNLLAAYVFFFFERVRDVFYCAKHGISLSLKFSFSLSAAR